MSRRKFLAIVVARLLVVAVIVIVIIVVIQNFNVVHYSNSIKGTGINTKLGILSHHDKLQDEGYHSVSYSFGVMALFN